MREKVLFIGPVAPPIGGMTNSMENLVNSELKEGYEVLVLDITGKRSRKRCSAIEGIFHQIFLLLKLLGLLFREKPAIVHCQMASYLYFYRRAVDILICKLFGKRVVFHLRGACFVDFYEESSFLGKILIRFILRLSDRIIALSEGWKRFLSGIAAKNKIRVVPNGVPSALYHRMTDKKEELSCVPSDVFVLFMGSIGKRKGVFDILDAAVGVVAIVSNIKFIFCGPEEEEGALARFEKKIEELGLNSHVRYIGTVSGQDKYDYYLSSDLFILPSYAENFPNAIIEAMAAGLPVIVSNVGGIPEFVEEGVHGFLVQPGDIQSITERIVLLAKNDALRISVGGNNLRAVKEKYDMETVSREVSGLYKEILEKT